MTSPANREPSVKKLGSSRPAGTATTCAPRNAAPMRSSASCSVATTGPSGSHTSTGTPARSRTSSGIAGHRRQDALDQAEQVGGRGGAAEYHDPHAVPLLVVHRLD